LLCCVTVAAGVVPDSEDAEASLRDVLAAVLGTPSPEDSRPVGDPAFVFVIRDSAT
jgi:hypothetical protein